MLGAPIVPAWKKLALHRWPAGHGVAEGTRHLVLCLARSLPGLPPGSYFASSTRASAHFACSLGKTLCWRYLGVPAKTSADAMELHWPTIKHYLWGSAESSDWRLLGQDSALIMPVARVRSCGGT